MKHFLLFYEFGEDYLERRPAFREAHLKKAWAAQEVGQLILAGAFANPVDGAALLFRSESAHLVESFARTDPYVVNGLAIKWWVREWTTVTGEGAMTPVRPAG